MSDLSLSSARRLWRYYQAGVVNTLFGYGLFALFVRVGLNMYVAQICAHLLGMAFNYFSYSRHVFHDAEASKVRFVLSYVFNYVIGLASLAAASLIFHSPYVAGIVSIVFVSLVNFFVLNNLVFFRKATQ